jgi:hypothetical protein
VTLHVLRDQGLSFREVAVTRGVSEGTVRYHRNRQGQVEGRNGKPRKAQALAEVIEAWVPQPSAGPAAADRARPVNGLALCDWLRPEHRYDGSYRSVLRFVPDRSPRPRLRPFRRVQTPPGAQAQVDGGAFSDLDVGDGPQALHAFVLVRSHARKEVLVWSRRLDPLSWHQAHDEA